jgi:hypothetical protein
MHPNQYDTTNRAASGRFAGFALPTSNTTYTPNQFFDVCLPHYSRGAIRLVAHIIRKTLGWCDHHGNPQAERHLVSYADFESAGISRGMIKSAVDEAIHGNFIRCVRPPKPSTNGQTSVTGLYELKWDDCGAYVKDPQQFHGFFAGEGNRTYIPNQFFDRLVPGESLAVLKVVGSVIRLSIGFQNKWGHRRRNVALSYQHIQNYTRMADRKSLSKAIQHALQDNYIERVEEGCFDPDAGRLSKAAVYAVKWLNQKLVFSTGMKTPPALNNVDHRYENPTGTGSITPPVERYENPTGIEIKQINKIYKQNEESNATMEMLRAAGFDGRTAQTMAARYSFDQVERQIGWIDARNAKMNRLGMLRKAIEQDWPVPSATRNLGRPKFAQVEKFTGLSFQDALQGMRKRLDDYLDRPKTS